MKIADYDQLPSRRIPVDGGEMFTIDVGQGPAVVLVHGNPVSSLEFRTVIGHLRSRFRVIAPDLLSFGQSDGPKGGAGFAEQATAVRGVLDALGLERFHLVGHDWGGPIALGAAAERPDQVDRLVLLNTSILPDFHRPLGWPPVVAPVVGEVAFVGANLMAFTLPVMMRAFRYDGELRERYLKPLHQAQTRRTMLRLERLDGYRSVCERIAGALPQMSGPKLLIWGTGDIYFRHEYRRLEEQIPGLQRLTLPGAGHFALEDDPERVSEGVSAFLSSDRPGRSEGT